MTTATKPVRRRTARKTSATVNPYVVMVYRFAMTAMILTAVVIVTLH